MALPNGFGYNTTGLPQAAAGYVALDNTTSQFQQADLTHGVVATSAVGGQLYASQPLNLSNPGGVTK